jgi:homoserine O-succinyltransferase
MPLVAHSRLPAFDTLRGEGLTIVPPEVAGVNGLPSLFIGMLNLMPDAALQATERQFLRLVDAYGSEANLYVYPFAVRAEYRAEIAVEHIATHYSTFGQLRDAGLDALIITGANPAESDITAELFWEPMIEIIDWSQTNVDSIVCSCLATHAILQHYHDTSRTELAARQWGVYAHELRMPEHPLLEGVNAIIHAPHSHRYAVSAADMERAGMTVLAVGGEAGLHLAVSGDPARFIFFQGHPEYDAISLLKEYKREVQRFLTGGRKTYPPFPEHYLDVAAKRRLEAYQRQVTESDFEQDTIPSFPEAELAGAREDTWSVAGRQIYRNWLAGVVARK